MREELLGFLKMHDVKYKERTRLADISPIRIGGLTEAVIYPDTPGKLISLIELLENNKFHYKILGRMSNVLPSDKKSDLIIVRTDLMRGIRFDGRLVVAECGVSIPNLANFLLSNGLSGMEGISGIPGSVGGATVGNAGAFGREMADVLVDVDLYDPISKERFSLRAHQLELAYRYSKLKDSGLVLLSSSIKPTSASFVSIKKEMDRVKQIRLNTQPTDFPSLGSVFKRTPNLPAAKLIDECGLKGYTVGGTQVSTKHAGFILNVGGATANDFIKLSDYVSNVVYDRYKIRLEREVEILQ